MHTCAGRLMSIKQPVFIILSLLCMLVLNSFQQGQMRGCFPADLQDSYSSHIVFCNKIRVKNSTNHFKHYIITFNTFPVKNVAVQILSFLTTKKKLVKTTKKNAKNGERVAWFIFTHSPFTFMLHGFFLCLTLIHHCCSKVALLS